MEKALSVCIKLGLVFLVIGMVYALLQGRAFSRNEVFIRDGLSHQSVTTVQENKNETKSLLFTGDVMLGRYVETLMGREGSSYPFGSTTDFLKEHITIANLEGPVPSSHVQTKIGHMSFSFPFRTPQVLREHGIHAVSLANNHTLDKGVLGYAQTKKALEKESIASFGGYSTTEPDYFKTALGTTTVIVYGINMISSTWDKSAAYRVTEQLHKDNPEAFLVAYIHWGNEYDLMQGDEQRELAHGLIERGAHAIIGSHPHVVQGVELYKGSLIFYSLGNFIFDQYFSKDVERGLLLTLAKEGDVIVYGLVPVASKKSRPYFPSKEVKQEILETIAGSSGSQLREMVLEGVLRLPLKTK